MLKGFLVQGAPQIIPGTMKRAIEVACPLEGPKHFVFIRPERFQRVEKHPKQRQPVQNIVMKKPVGYRELGGIRQFGKKLLGEIHIEMGYAREDSRPLKFDNRIRKSNFCQNDTKCLDNPPTILE